MQKKYVVRLIEQEREMLNKVIDKLTGSSQKVRRAHMLLKADADGPNWTDQRIAEAFNCLLKWGKPNVTNAHPAHKYAFETLIKC